MDNERPTLKFDTLNSHKDCFTLVSPPVDKDDFILAAQLAQVRRSTVKVPRTQRWQGEQLDYPECYAEEETLP